MLKFKERPRTDYFLVTYEDVNGLNVDDLKAEAKKIGDFDVGFHYLIHKDGWIEHGRDDKAWAGHRCVKDYKVTLWVLVDGEEEEGLTDNQRASLEYLHSLYPESTIVGEDGEE